MPGPGPHMIYTVGSGLGLMHASNGRFSPQHCIIYAANAFLGPDLGSFSEWLASVLGRGRLDMLGSLAMDAIHHPFYYILLLGLPFSLLYNWLSRFFLQRGLLDSFSGVCSNPNTKQEIYKNPPISLYFLSPSSILICLF